MLGGRQIKNILDNSFASSASIAGLVAPTTTFTCGATYNIPLYPLSIVFSGVITPNDATSVTWNIKNELNVVVASGSNSTPSFTLLSFPSVPGSYVYTLEVNYTLGATTNTIYATASYTAAIPTYAGPLTLPTDTITVPADIIPFLSTWVTDGLDSLSKTQIINPFTVDVLSSARISLVIPDYYGAIVDIVDGNDISVFTQFDVVVDAPNTRKIYTTNSAVGVASYIFKVIY